MGQRMHRNILFLCTGNYFRSRFAEILFNSVAGKMGLPWQASSRGLALERSVNNVGSMAVEAVKALEALGVSAGYTPRTPRAEPLNGFHYLRAVNCRGGSRPRIADGGWRASGKSWYVGCCAAIRGSDGR
jgi:protein-tyrosine-phosphatase